MRLKLLVLSVMLSSPWQLNCMNKVRLGIGVSTTILGIGSLAWQIYNKDYSLKKSLITGSLFVMGIGSCLLRNKQANSQVMPSNSQVTPCGKMPILYKQIVEITGNKNYDKLQELIRLHDYKEVNRNFGNNLFTLLMNWYKDGIISAQQFYNLGLDNLGWDKIINAYKYGYLHIGHIREILREIKNHEEINNLSISETVDYDYDNYEWNDLGDVMSPLHYAVQSDDTLPLVQLLIEEGADVYMYSKKGQSVYDYALNYGALKTVKYIKKYVKLQIALGLNCRDIVFSGSKSREFCISKLSRERFASMNHYELEKAGSEMMLRRMKKGQNTAFSLPGEIIEHITDYILAPKSNK